VIVAARGQARLQRWDWRGVSGDFELELEHALYAGAAAQAAAKAASLSRRSA
jgi:hypothetical protein